MKPFDGTIPDPLDKQAAMMFAKGEKHRVGLSNNRFHSDAPPRVQPWLNANRRNPADDLTGRTVGRLTVIGYAAEHSGKWVVRCVCGLYELRSAKAVKNPANDRDACADCRTLDQAKRHEHWRRTGKDLF